MTIGAQEPPIEQQIAEIVIIREISRAIKEQDTEQALREWQADQEVDIPIANFEEICELIDTSRVHIKVTWAENEEN